MATQGDDYRDDRGIDPAGNSCGPQGVLDLPVLGISVSGTFELQFPPEGSGATSVFGAPMVSCVGQEGPDPQRLVPE